MPRAEKDSGPQDKAKWTDSKVQFVLNKFLTEKENGHLMGTTWKPIAFTNVTASYNLAYSNEMLTVQQIKNCYSSRKSIYAAAKKLKENTGIGWVEGECRIDMPQEWWNDEGLKHKDALQFQKHPFIFFDQMDELLHFYKPTGSLRTGTSNGANSSKINGGIEQPEETANPIETTSNKISNSKTAPSKPTKRKQPDSDDSDTSISLVKPAKTNNKKKTPAREVKPGTLANAIAAASTNSVLRTQKLLNSKATQSAERDTAIAAAAQIRSKQHAHQQEAITIFNVKSKLKFPDVQDRLMAIDVIAEEREAALFAGLADEMAWIWLENQVVKEKKKLEKNE
ncbi:hypothetical protein DFH28DRAFT_1135617 [Melampsora americana]|nr:hypothetical protein DFH28DRAFT_1135617 [Melampsora americana]